MHDLDIADAARVNSLEEHWMPFSGNRDFKNNPRLCVAGQGMYYTNQKGDPGIDGSSALFCSPAGHARPEIAEAVYKQLQTNSYTPHFQLGHPGSFELARKVAALLPEHMNYVFFTNSGSESIDTALKMVMAYHRARGESQRLRFVSRERAYHGVNMGGVSLAGMVKNRETFPVTLPNIVTIRHTWTGKDLFHDGLPEHDGVELANDLERHCATYGGSTIAAVFVEPVARSTGTLVPPKGYLERLRQICDQHGILLVFDAVITGFGRLGAPFASQLFGVMPDICTMAKALTNGSIPMGAVACRDEIYETVTNAAPENAIEFFHGYTFSGHPAACAAGIAAQDIYENEKIFEKGRKLAPYFEKKLFELEGMDRIRDIRCIGLFAGVELKPDGVPGSLGTRCQKELFWNGMHVKFTGDVGCVAPPFIAEEAHIDEMVDKLRATIEAL